MLNFPDGNIVLKADKYQCRVHRGIVALHSVVLEHAIARAIEVCPLGVDLPPVVVSADDDILELYMHAVYGTVQ